MIPTEADPSVYPGDVYVFQDGVIMEIVGGMQFRRYLRILMNRFFAAPDSSVAMSYTAASFSSPAVPAPAPAPAVSQPKPTVYDIAKPLAPRPIPVPVPTNAPIPTAPAAIDSDSTSSKALVLIAREAGLDLSDLVDDAAFAGIGVDSLMSLVIAEKFREELGIVVAGSFFLEYPTVGSLRSWLEEYYS
jgi:Phosphopantetheine attachment site.